MYMQPKARKGIGWSGLVMSAMIAFFGCLLVSGFQAGAQTNTETFGQNRVQYRDFSWRFFETEHFRIYHYDAAGRQLARYVAEQVEKDIAIIEQKMGGSFPGQFKIMVYNSYDDYRQSNIGRKYDGQLQDIPAGTVDLVGDKLVVYFTGVHTDLRRQTRAGMSRVVMERMLFGENFRDMVKNAILMNLPEWTVNGFIAYLVDGWDTRAHSDWFNLMAAHPNEGFHELAERDPSLAGKAFWKYVDLHYGAHRMKSLLYNMQTKSSLSQGIRMSLGQKVKQAYDSTMAFYRREAELAQATRANPDTAHLLFRLPSPGDGAEIREIKVSPRGHDIAYVQWKEGKFSVIIQQTRGDGEKAEIVSGGRKDYNEVPDPNYPLLAWSNDGYKLAILYKEKNRTRLRIYNSLKAKIENRTIPSTRFDRVLGMSFMEDDKKMVISAIRKSQTDLYEFVIRGSRLQPITQDAWDDLQPWYVSGGSRKGILFLSNRPAPNLEVPIGVNELPVGPMHVYFYNTTTASSELVRLSDFDHGQVSQPIQYGPEHYAFLYDGNGIRNQYVVTMGRNTENMDSAIALPVTDHSLNIVYHQYNPMSNQKAEVIRRGGDYLIYFSPLVFPDPQAPLNLDPVRLSKDDRDPGLGALPAPAPRAATETAGDLSAEPSSLFQSGNLFQSPFASPLDSTGASAEIGELEPAVNAAQPVQQLATVLDEEAPMASPGSEEAEVDSSFVKLRPQRYRHGFKPDFFTVRLDNAVLFNKYQPVAHNGGEYTNPSLGGMLTVSLDDIMENHRFTGGIRLPINFSGLTYFLQYENFRRRLDWGLMYLRNENYFNEVVLYQDNSGSPVIAKEELMKTTSSLLQGHVRYPFDRVRSLRFDLGLRQDRLTLKAQDEYSLLGKPQNESLYWAMSSAAYIFDNTCSPSLNIYQGFRYKFFAEYLYALHEGNGGFYNLGTDFRAYFKIYKNITLANRLAAAHSGGNQKILYTMGGVDNWINASYSRYVPVRPTENYAFQALATNLRGYAQNARNGNSYALLNTELRVPVLTSFLKHPVSSPFLRHLQWVAFVDAGSAWNGLLPNADALRNDQVLVEEPVRLHLKDQTGGLGLGYGMGLRTSLFGYFIRFDYAWSIEGYRMGHLSLGLDF